MGTSLLNIGTTVAGGEGVEGWFRGGGGTEADAQPATKKSESSAPWGAVDGMRAA